MGVKYVAYSKKKTEINTRIAGYCEKEDIILRDELRNLI